MAQWFTWVFLISFFLGIFTHLVHVEGEPSSAGVGANPIPSPWPEQFHSILYINNSGSLQVTDLWYDWPNGRNFNIIQKQLGGKLYDLEWDNGTSFYYYLDKNDCKKMHFDVGILRPNWLEGANYLGVQSVDGFLCNVWEKVDFIWYYEDIVSKRPVHWLFYTGMSAHVMTFEVGVVLEDAEWQPPSYCFDKDNYELAKPKGTTSLHRNMKAILGEGIAWF